MTDQELQELESYARKELAYGGTLGDRAFDKEVRGAISFGRKLQAGPIAERLRQVRGNLESSAKSKTPTSDQEETPRREPQQTDEPIPRESVDKSESVEVPQQAQEPEKAGYDSRDKEIGKTIKGLKQEKFHREKQQNEGRMQFAKAGGSALGNVMGGMLRKSIGVGIPHGLKDPLMAAVGSMFSESGEARSGVPMFGEGADAAMGGEGGGENGGDMGAKLDRIIELLAQLVQASGQSTSQTGIREGEAGPAGVSQQLAAGAGVAAQFGAASAQGASGGEEPKYQMWEEAGKAMIRALMAAAIA